MQICPLNSKKLEEVDDPMANKLTPGHLGLLLLDCMQLPRVFGEIASFGDTFFFYWKLRVQMPLSAV